MTGISSTATCRFLVTGLLACLVSRGIVSAEDLPSSHSTGGPDVSKSEAQDPGGTRRASGTFEVELTPQTDGQSESPTLGRMSIEKRFHGDLEATSKGQMLSAMTAVKGSAGYVAIEEVRGTLQGRRGTFVLQHSGTMTRGAPRLSVTVVPDSGTDQLAGLAGTMTIEISGGKHSYEFEYTLAETP